MPGDESRHRREQDDEQGADAIAGPGLSLFPRPLSRFCHHREV